MVEALALALQPPASPAPDAQPETVEYICGYMRNRRSNVDPRRHTDLRLVRRGDQRTSQWTMTWPDRPQIAATGASVIFGNHGGESLRWQENGSEKRAYIAHSGAQLQDGSRVFWFSLNRPSLWETPGYICQSETPQTGVEH